MSCFSKRGERIVDPVLDLFCSVVSLEGGNVMLDWIRWLVGAVVATTLVLGLCALDTQATERQRLEVFALPETLGFAPQFGVLALDASPHRRFNTVGGLSIRTFGAPVVLSHPSVHFSQRSRGGVRSRCR